MHKKRVLISLLNVLKDNPIFIYQLVVFTKFPSLSSAGMVVVGLVANHLFLNILLMINHTVSRLKVIFGYLNKLKGSSYQTFPVREFFVSDNQTYEDIDKWFVKSWFRWFGINDVNLDHLVHIHVAESPYCVANLASYPLALFESHIFVNDIPKDTKGVRRFYLLHEIGHTQLKIVNSDYALLAGIKHYLFYLCWVGLTIIWTQDAVMSILAFVLALIIWSHERGRRMELIMLFDEILADCFALAYLSKEDLKMLEKNKYFPSLLYDADMPPLYNAVRLSKLKENLLLTLNDKHDEVLEETFKMIPFPKLLMLTVSMLLIALLGLYAAPPTLWALFWLFILDVILLIFFLLTFIISNSMSAIIKSKLKENPSLPH